MNRAEARARVVALIDNLPLPDEHEVWPALYHGAREGLEGCLKLSDLIDAAETNGQQAPHPAEKADPEVTAAAVLGHLQGAPGRHSHAQLVELTKLPPRVLTLALQRLKRGQLVLVDGRGRRARYSSAKLSDAAAAALKGSVGP